MGSPPSTPPPRKLGADMSVGRRYAMAVEFFFFPLPTLSFRVGKAKYGHLWADCFFVRPFGRMVQAMLFTKKTPKISTTKRQKQIGHG